MGRGAPGLQDQEVETVLGNLLRAGVFLSAGLVLLGGIWYLFKYGSTVPAYGVFRGEPSEFRSVGLILESAYHGHSRGLIQLGLLALIATPIARVAMSAVAFFLERDWAYVWITLIVLAILLYSLVGPHPTL